MARIEFCGGIGAGKSTCAGLVAARLGRPLVSERFADNPYWQLFYHHPAAHALEKDLSFLLLHADGIREAGPTPAVCDFAMFQTVSYARIAGTAPDVAAVRAVAAAMLARLGQPDLVVRLACPVAVQLDRIRRRGRVPEAGIDADYLHRLDHAITAELAQLPAGLPVVTLDATRPPAAVAADPALLAALANWPLAG